MFKAGLLGQFVIRSVGIVIGVDATVTSGASGDALAAERLWLSAAVVAFATATWTTILRPETGATA